MRAFLVLLITMAGLSACINLGSSQSVAKTYDLGGAYKDIRKISNTAFFLNQISANDAIDSISILYRLIYKDPNQIMAYSESHWRISPVELISARFIQASSIPVRSRSVRSMVGNCAVDMTILALEQRFSSESQADAMVDWKVAVTDVKNRRFINEKRFTYKVPMGKPNASSGVSALSTGVDMAIVDTLNWLSNDVLMQYPNCDQKKKEDAEKANGSSS